MEDQLQNITYSNYVELLKSVTSIFLWDTQSSGANMRKNNQSVVLTLWDICLLARWHEHEKIIFIEIRFVQTLKKCEIF